MAVDSCSDVFSVLGRWCFRVVFDCSVVGAVVVIIYFLGFSVFFWVGFVLVEQK